MVILDPVVMFWEVLVGGIFPLYVFLTFLVCPLLFFVLLCISLLFFAFLCFSLFFFFFLFLSSPYITARTPTAPN